MVHCNQGLFVLEL